MCFLPIYSGHQVRSLDVPAGVTQEEGHTGFLIHLPSAVHAFIFAREGFSRSFPPSTVKSDFVYYDLINRSPLLVGHFFFIFIFLVRKNPSYRDSNPRPNVSEGYEVTN